MMPVMEDNRSLPDLPAAPDLPELVLIEGNRLPCGMLGIYCRRINRNMGYCHDASTTRFASFYPSIIYL